MAGHFLASYRRNESGWDSRERQSKPETELGCHRLSRLLTQTMQQRVLELC